jgi:hypothetical protein
MAAARGYALAGTMCCSRIAPLHPLADGAVRKHVLVVHLV